MSILLLIKKYLSIYLSFIKITIQIQMEYRVNFYMSITVECAYLFAKLLYIKIIYQTNLSIDGITPDIILIIIGTHSIVTSFYVGFFVNNFYSLTNSVRDGTLDILMVKPVSSQFILSTRYFDIGLFLPEFVAGIIMVAKGIYNLGIIFPVMNFVMFFCFIIISLIITYSIFLLPHLLSFRFIATEGVNGIADQLWESNNMPMEIYDKLIQRIGIFILPVFIISNFPVKVLLSELPVYLLLFSFLIAILLFFLVRMVWKSAVKAYNSASS